ncbi:MAG: hypothetical protein ABH837_00205 [bacterium]
MDDQTNQTSSSAEIQPPSRKWDILDSTTSDITPKPSATSATRSPELINQDLLSESEINVRSPKYAELLKELSSAIQPNSTQTTRTTETLQPQVSQPEIQTITPETAPNPFQILKNNLGQIDPAYSADLDQLQIRAREQGLNTQVIKPIIPSILDLSNHTITEIKQAQSEQQSQNPTGLSSIAETVIPRLLTGSLSPQIQTACDEITRIYHIEPATQTTNPKLEIQKTPPTSQTPEEEIQILGGEIIRLQGDKESLEKQLSDTQISNTDLENQFKDSKEKAKTAQAQYTENFEKLPSNKRLAA